MNWFILFRLKIDQNTENMKSKISNFSRFWGKAVSARYIFR